MQSDSDRAMEVGAMGDGAESGASGNNTVSSDGNSAVGDDTHSGGGSSLRTGEQWP